MRRWLIRFLHRLLRWLEGPPPPVPVLDRSPLDDEARILTAEAERLPGEPSGEFKRHVVLAKLMKAFPGTPTRRLARAIEDNLP